MPGAPPRRAVLPTLLAAILFAVLGLVLPACAGDVAPDLLHVVDVVPRSIDVGDRVEILGANLPTSDARTAVVVFEGELRRPGQAPLVGQRFEVDRAQVAGDRISFPIGEALHARICGQGDDAVHTTFRGSVTARIPSAGPGGLEVKGTAPGIVLDFIPQTPRRAVADAREREGARALGFLGITAAPDVPPSGGIAVDGVREGSPASRAGVQPGDVIVGLEGVRILTVSDLIPSGHERAPVIEVLRGDAPPIALTVSVEGFKPSGSSDLLGAAVILGFAAGLILLFLAPTARLLAWLERRVSARIGTRAAAGTMVEAARALLKEEPGALREEAAPPPSSAADGALLRLAPYLVFIGVSATFVVMPFGHQLVGADLDIGVLFLITLTALVSIALVTGGWSASGRWSLLGALRAAAQIIAYEIPAATAVVCVVMMTGSLRVQDIIAAQGGPGGSPLEVGGWPWYWFVFRSPITFALFALYFTATLAEGARAQGTVPEAEGAPAAAPRAGLRQALFFFAEWANVFVMCGLASAIFLGGWQVPGIASAAHEGRIGLLALGALLFLVKSWLLIAAVVWLRWALPRVRVDQMTSLCWRWFVPLTLAAAALTALWMVARVPQTAQLAISLVTFALWAFATIHFARRVQRASRGARVPLHLNPFL